VYTESRGGTRTAYPVHLLYSIPKSTGPSSYSSVSIAKSEGRVVLAYRKLWGVRKMNCLSLYLSASSRSLAVARRRLTSSCGPGYGDGQWRLVLF
jgi:hypothetical protein